MTYLLPYLLSFAVGYLGLNFLMGQDKKLSGGLFFFLSLGLGLGVSAEICFASFPLFDSLNRGFVITVHLIIMAALWLLSRPRFEMKRILSFRLTKESRKEFFAAALLSLTFFAFWAQANLYPYGGWDAWSCWNLKSKFLFLGGDHWRNMLSPPLWRSSPHYPLLLPLINVWGWIFVGEPSYLIPLFNSLVFTALTAGLLFCGLKAYTKNLLAAALGASLILTLPFFVKLATSQYSDIVVAYFLLAGFFCLLSGLKEHQKSFFILAGIFLGFLGFSKIEGLTASLLIIMITVFYISLTRTIPKDSRKNLLGHLLAGFIIASLPAIIFKIQYAPVNQTFINGLFSSDHPTNLYRIKMILSFYLLEVFTNKWNGLWILLFAGLLSTRRSCLKEHRILFPIFFAVYAVVITCYYFINTYFEIGWWLSVTLNRILFSMLPVAVFWVFCSLWNTDPYKNKNGL